MQGNAKTFVLLCQSFIEVKWTTQFQPLGYDVADDAINMVILSFELI